MLLRCLTTKLRKAAAAAVVMFDFQTFAVEISSKSESFLLKDTQFAKPVIIGQIIVKFSSLICGIC